MATPLPIADVLALSVVQFPCMARLKSSHAMKLIEQSEPTRRDRGRFLFYEFLGPVLVEITVKVDIDGADEHITEVVETVHVVDVSGFIAVLAP